MTRLLPMVVLAILLVSTFVAFATKWQNMYGEGYSANPFKWAQERRERENAARAVRIMQLEHEVGLHAEIDATCWLCDRDKRAALDRKWLGNEIFDFPYLPPRPTAQPDRIKK